MSPCALLPWKRPGTSLLAELVPQVLLWPAVTITDPTRRRALLEKLTVTQQLNKFSAICGTVVFIAVFAKACH